MNYRGIEIVEYVDKRSGLTKFKARFQYKNQEFTPKKSSLDSLKQEINRILADADAGRNPKLDYSYPFLSEVLTRELESIKDPKKKTFYTRVYEDFLLQIPQIKINELTQADIMAYCHYRLSQTSQSTGRPIKNATVNKELSAI